MSSSWGKDQHGPGGDPSWLGGKDRGTAGGGAGANGSTGWSSDFSSDVSSGAGHSAPDSDFGSDGGGSRSTSALPTHGPQFGRSDGADARADNGWRSGFSGGGDGGSRQRSGNMGQEVVRGLVSIGVIIVFAFVIGGLNDSNMGFFLLVAILPIAIRLVKKLFGETGRR